MASDSQAVPDVRYFQLANYNIALLSIFMGIDIVVVGLRIWARKKQNIAFQLDDWLILPALLLTIAAAAVMISCKYT